MRRKSIIKIICSLFLILTGSFKYASAQSEVTAIDVLLDPGQSMMDSAKTFNDLMHNNYSGAGSYSLDAIHSPHITVLQCFVRTADLKKVYAAIAEVVKTENPTKEKLTASGLYYLPYGSLGLAGITVEPTTRLLSFQSKLIEAVKQYIVKGDNAAFVQNANGTPIAAGVFEYVNGFVPDHSGTKYNPHVTIGLAQGPFLKDLISKPFNKFTFKSPSVSIYHLGDFGTAQVKLWTNPKSK